MSRLNHVINLALRTTSRLMPIQSLINWCPKKLIAPFYHTVSDIPLLHANQLYELRNIRTFTNELDFFLKHYLPIDLNDLVNDLTIGDIFTKPVVFFTFDDGFSEVYHIIAPILYKKGVNACFFINSSFVDNNNLFYRCKASLLVNWLKNKDLSFGEKQRLESQLPLGKGSISQKIMMLGYADNNTLDSIANILGFNFDEYLKQQKPYMSLEQLKQLIAMGFSVGAHSANHPLYSALTLEQQIMQTDECLQYVADNLPQPYSTFSFPFTDFDVGANFFDWLYRQPQAKVDCSFGTARMNNDSYPLHIHRIPMEDSLHPASQIMKQEYMKFGIKQILKRNTITRK